MICWIADRSADQSNAREGAQARRTAPAAMPAPGTYAPVAQLEERQSEDLSVGSSNLPGGTFTS